MKYTAPAGWKNRLSTPEQEQRLRLGNQAKSRLEETEKHIIYARRKALGVAEKDYTERQAKTLGKAGITALD